MAYERLNLQDFIDVITAANLSHIEDGIVNNETKVKTIESTLNSVRNTANNNTNSINNLSSTVNNVAETGEELIKSQVINDFFPLWHTLLSYGGEKIFPPTLSFDGNIIGKTSFFLSSGSGIEKGIGYVRIGDDIGSQQGVITCGGLYHVLWQMVCTLQANNSTFIEQFGDLASAESGLMLLMSAVTQGEDVYDNNGNLITIYNSPMLEMMTEENQAIKSFLQMFLPSLFSDAPLAFSIDKDFEYNGIIYPSGFYSAYINSDPMSAINSHGAWLDLPMLYVDKFWVLGPSASAHHQLNMPLDYSKASNAFDYIDKETIFWNGDRLETDAIIPADHPLSNLPCISYNPQGFLQACLSATEITADNLTVNLTTVALGEYDDSKMKTYAYVLGNLIVIIPTVCNLDGEWIMPGVYALAEVESFKLQFHGIDVQTILNKHQINHQYLPEVPEFNLIEMGMAEVPLTGDFIYLQANTSKLKSCSRKGPVRITIPTTMGEVSCLATFNSIDSAHQSVITGYYNAIKFDAVIGFTDNTIGVAIIPVSQMA